jgi:hypothetical protein
MLFGPLGTDQDISTVRQNAAHRLALILTGCGGTCAANETNAGGEADQET